MKEEWGNIEKYGVTNRVIGLIVKNKTYKNVKQNVQRLSKAKMPPIWVCFQLVEQSISILETGGIFLKYEDIV